MRKVSDLLIVLVCFFLPFVGVSQTTFCEARSINANWYFGEEAGVDFNNTPPNPLTNGQIDHPIKPSAVISDDVGNLLFYTDGNTVYSANHLPMMNGNGTLLGSGAFAQDVVIVAGIKRHSD